MGLLEPNYDECLFSEHRWPNTLGKQTNKNKNKIKKKNKNKKTANSGKP